MRAAAVGRTRRLARFTAWALGTLSVGAVAVTVLLIWEVLMDPLALAQALEAVVGLP